MKHAMAHTMPQVMKLFESGSLISTILLYTVTLLAYLYKYSLKQIFNPIAHIFNVC